MGLIHIFTYSPTVSVISDDTVFCLSSLPALLWQCQVKIQYANYVTK